MEYIYSALLIHKLGAELTQERVKKVIETAGGKADDIKARALMAALEGVNIDEVIKQAAIPVASAAPAEAKTEAKDDKKKSVEDEKKAEESASAGLGMLFG